MGEINEASRLIAAALLFGLFLTFATCTRSFAQAGSTGGAIGKEDKSISGEDQPAARAVMQPPANEAERAWALTKDTTSRAVLQTFIKRFGNTIYGEMASARLKELDATTQKPPGHAVNAVAGSKIFDSPTINGIRVDGCMKWGPTGCGDDAANYWCRSKGFSRATTWNVEKVHPTTFQDPNSAVKVCDFFFCGAFSQIVCE